MKPVTPEIVYFKTLNGYHELLADTPARVTDARRCAFDYLPIEKVSEGAEAEAYVDGCWVPGRRMKSPTNYKFVVECVSFGSEQEVWNALHRAVTEMRTVAPWFKIVPPSRQ